ncbi:hypothetical protein A2W24_07055 [Microgenomates group bacterium RBG_16_45_19]|nr:MAG: hypothetical protein A2W24_07055 [Microgenomates group bacterium RBG_16_45_19]
MASSNVWTKKVNNETYVKARLVYLLVLIGIAVVVGVYVFTGYLYSSSEARGRRSLPQDGEVTRASSYSNQAFIDRYGTLREFTLGSDGQRRLTEWCTGNNCYNANGTMRTRQERDDEAWRIQVEKLQEGRKKYCLKPPCTE